MPDVVPVVADPRRAFLPTVPGFSTVGFTAQASDVLGDSSGVVDSVQVVANPVTEKDTSRPFGFVPMDRGEFSACEAQLKSQSVYAETPAEFLDVLDDIFLLEGSQLVGYCEVRPCPSSALVG